MIKIDYHHYFSLSCEIVVIQKTIILFQRFKFTTFYSTKHYGVSKVLTGVCYTKKI